MPAIRTYLVPRTVLPVVMLLALAFLPQIAGLVDNPFLIRVGMRIDRKVPLPADDAATAAVRAPGCARLAVAPAR